MATTLVAVTGGVASGKSEVTRRFEALGVTVRTTFLGAHALPPEYAGRSSDYIRLVCEDMLDAGSDR